MRTALRFLCLLPMTGLALDLTPIPAFKELEGVKIPQLKFAHGASHMTWRPPADWRMSFEEGRLLFLPKDYAHASFELRVLPRVAGDLEILTKSDTLQSYAGNFFPKSATEVAYKSANEGPFTINALPAREFLLDFREPGHATLASFSVVDLNDRERLIVIITAQPKDFEAVRTAAIQSLFSWQGQ